MNKQPQIPYRRMIARSCPCTSIAHDRRGRRRNSFLRWLSIAAILLVSGHPIYAQGAADALFIDEKGNLSIGTTTFIYQSGNVGIGTATPHAPLEVMQKVNGLLTGLQFGGQHTSGDTAGGVINAYDADGSTVRYLTLQSNGGNVGIGTMQPNSTLDVKGRIYAQQLAFTDADGKWYPDNWIGMADNIGEKTPWLMVGGITDNRKKENEKTGSVDGDGKRRIALYANTTYVADELIVENTITAKRVNGEKPPLVFEVGKKGDLGKWNAVEQDIGPLCGDADGCTMKFMLRDNGNDQVRTISEQIYIEQTDKSSNKSPGQHGWARQLGGGDQEFVLQTANKYDLVPYPWNWIYVRNYSSPEVGTQSGAYSGYKVQFMTRPNVATTVIIYDR